MKTIAGSSFSTHTKRAQLCMLPEFQPIEENAEPQEFIKGFEKFAEDIQGFMESRDEQFSSVTNRRRTNKSQSRASAAILQKRASVKALSPTVVPKHDSCQP